MRLSSLASNIPRFQLAPKDHFKTITNAIAIHEAQLLSYLKLAGCQVGLLINFNVKLLKNGIRRIIN
jgi:hypothetical protein